MTVTDEKKYRLYPRKEDFMDGEWRLHNDDEFFRYSPPEYFQKMLAEGWKLESTIRKINGRDIEFIRCPECLDRECWRIFVELDENLFIHEGFCDAEIERAYDLKYHELQNNNPHWTEGEVREKAHKHVHEEYTNYAIELHRNQRIVSAFKLQYKLDFSRPSSPYRHPRKFSFIDRIDEPTKQISWLVDGLIPEQSLCSFHGERESFKSFLAVHLALCVATGTNFFGREVQQGVVLYIAPEGSTGIGVRRDAWLKEYDWLDCYVPFYKRSGAFSLTRSEDKDWLADLFIGEFSPRLVIFDTLGQSLGDADENSASDINRIARYLNDLKLSHHCSFFWIDHSGHEGGRARGSSAKGAALDVEFFVKRKGNQIVVKNTKMKDAPRADTFCLAAHAKHDSLLLEKAIEEPTHADVLFDIISEANGGTEAELRRSFYLACNSKTQAAKQKAFVRALEKLTVDEVVLKSENTNGEIILTMKGGHTPPSL